MTVLGLLLVVVSASGGHAVPPVVHTRPVTDPSDVRLASLTRALDAWNSRPNRGRAVVDRLVLVPDEAAFLEALGGWTEAAFYPILLESDPESVLRFTRVFRPGRIDRLGGRSPDPNRTDDERWGQALTSISRALGVSQRVPEDAALLIPRLDSSPGVVIASTRGHALAGAAALAAGRRQGIVRCDQNFPGTGETVPAEVAMRMGQVVDRIVASGYPSFNELGDELDFVTLAVPWADRFDPRNPAEPGPYSVDDVLCRVGPLGRRYAFVGRLSDSEAASVYQAMCSLFLQPESALLFNSYDLDPLPWSDFSMQGASRTLEPFCRTTLRDGRPVATLRGWHEALGSVSDFGLVLLNSSGTPTTFNLGDQGAQTRDVPWSAPSAVIAIHSFSASAPADPATIAGRWLANGAFLYFGALEEPYLQSFRPPSLVAALIARGAPVSAAVHKIPGEDIFGEPWRLHLIGDPQYRIAPRAGRTIAREPAEGPIEGGSMVDTTPAAGSASGPDARTGLLACWDQVLRDSGRSEVSPAVVAARLAEISRTGLDSASLAIYDTLLADVIVRGEPELWKPTVEKLPDAARTTGTIGRALEARQRHDALMPGW